MKIKKEDIAPIKGEIIDIFEDCLDDADIALQCDDREDAIHNGEDPNGLAIIYGSHYDFIGDVIESILTSNGKQNNKKDAKQITDQFMELVSIYHVDGSDTIYEDTYQILCEKVESILESL